MRLLPLTLLLAGAAAEADEGRVHDDARGHLLQRTQTRLLRLTGAKGALPKTYGGARGRGNGRRNLAKKPAADDAKAPREGHIGIGSEDVSADAAVFTSPPVSTEQPTRPPSGVWDTPCELCPDGLTVAPGFELPAGIVNPAFNLEPNENGAYTCGMAVEYASTLDVEDALCPLVQLAGMFCCPPSSVPATPASSEADTVAVNAPPLAVEAPEIASLDNSCVCSPRSYTMKLDLPSLCDVDDLDSNDGIGLTLCVVLYGDQEDGNATSTSRLLLAAQEEDARKLKTRTAKSPRENHLSQHQLHKVEIFDIQFLEFGTQGQLTVIHQEDLQVSLMNGDSFSFDSISRNLDPSVPLGEQSDFVPGGVQLTLRGRLDFETEDGTVEEKLVNQRVTWSYTNGCDGTLPVAEGDAIGWVTFESLEDPATDFCPIAPTTTTTTTTATTTTAALVTGAPTAQPTPNPTPSPTAEMSMVAKSAKAMFSYKTKAHKQGSLSMFGKSGKGVDAKGGKDHMAKQSDMSVSAKSAKLAKAGDESSGKSGKLFKKGDMSVSAVDSKAEKQSSAEGEGSSKGQAKTYKQSSKGSGLSMPSSSKGSKAEGDTMSMPSGKSSKQTDTADAKAKKKESSSGPYAKAKKEDTTAAKTHEAIMHEITNAFVGQTKTSKVHANEMSIHPFGKSSKEEPEMSVAGKSSKSASSKSAKAADAKAEKQDGSSADSSGWMASTSSTVEGKAAKKQPAEAVAAEHASMPAVHEKESEEKDYSGIHGAIQRWFAEAASYIKSWFRG